MRAYELMIIFNGDLEEAAVRSRLEEAGGLVTGAGGRVVTTDVWGKRRFAYEIDHKHEGFYVVLELVTDGPGFPDMERSLRLADDVVRHKLLRLPDHEAVKRGLLGEATPA